MRVRGDPRCAERAAVTTSQTHHACYRITWLPPRFKMQCAGPGCLPFGQRWLCNFRPSPLPPPQAVPEDISQVTIYMMSFPLAQEALASTAAQPDLSQDSALFCLLCPLRVAGPRLPSQRHRLLPQGPPTGTLPSESLWKTRRYDYICMVVGRVRCPRRAITWPLCHQNSAVNSWKQGGHSASRKR